MKWHLQIMLHLMMIGKIFYIYIHIYIYTSYVYTIYTMYILYIYTTVYILYSLTRATLMRPGKNETRVCEYIYIYIYIYIKKSSGSSMKPWRTPALTSAQEEVCTLCFLFFKKFDNRIKRLPDIPFCFSLKIIPSCPTLSKP